MTFVELFIGEQVDMEAKYAHDINEDMRLMILYYYLIGYIEIRIYSLYEF